jgi:hypothetical protein
MVFQQDGRPAEGRLSDKLTELLRIENEISTIMRRSDNLRGKPLLAVRDHIRDALHKAYEIAYIFNPKEMSIEAGIGVPPRVSVRFSWPIAEEAKKEELSLDELFR